jgi:hypothetical protein
MKGLFLTGSLCCIPLQKQHYPKATEEKKDQKINNEEVHNSW